MAAVWAVTIGCQPVVGFGPLDLDAPPTSALVVVSANGEPTAAYAQDGGLPEFGYRSGESLDVFAFGCELSDLGIEPGPVPLERSARTPFPVPFAAYSGTAEEGADLVAVDPLGDSREQAAGVKHLTPCETLPVQVAKRRGRTLMASASVGFGVDGDRALVGSFAGELDLYGAEGFLKAADLPFTPASGYRYGDSTRVVSTTGEIYHGQIDGDLQKLTRLPFPIDTSTTTLIAGDRTGASELICALVDAAHLYWFDGSDWKGAPQDGYVDLVYVPNGCAALTWSGGVFFFGPEGERLEDPDGVSRPIRLRYDDEIGRLVVADQRGRVQIRRGPDDWMLVADLEGFATEHVRFGDAQLVGAIVNGRDFSSEMTAVYPGGFACPLEASSTKIVARLIPVAENAHVLVELRGLEVQNPALISVLESAKVPTACSQTP